MTKWILESARTVLGEKNNCTIAKMGWLSKKDSRKLYESMIIYFICKTQLDKFVEQGLFKVVVENTYTDISYNTNPFEKGCFNCQQFGYRNKSSTRLMVYSNNITLGFTHI